MRKLCIIACVLQLLFHVESRPNILLITVDDMNWDSVGAYGCPVENITPNIDHFASQGVLFDYGYVNIAICTPSRQVILTGSHSHQTMTRGFTRVERVGPALPDLLKENGYYIAQVNKQQQFYPWDSSIRESSDIGRNTTRHEEILKNLMNAAGEKPWFIVYNLNDPHRPFFGAQRESAELSRASSQPSRIYKTEEIVVPGFLPDLPDIRQEMAEYYSSVRRADDGVRVLLETMKSQLNDTIVVFMSDNGISNPFAKVNCYQASLRVPFILRYPPKLEPKRDRTNMVSAVDLAPTLLELVNITVPQTMAGRSFVPLLLQGQDQDHRDHVIGYYYRNLRQSIVYPEFAVHMRDWVYIYNPWVDGTTQVHNSDYTNSLTLLAMWEAAKTVASIRQRTDFHRYRVREELYNLRQDPHSYVNLAADSENRPRVAAMQELLVNWMEETNHPAITLMQDPYNEELIQRYMTFEECTAEIQINEEESGKASNATCSLSSSTTESVPDTLWFWMVILLPLTLALVLAICRHKRHGSESRE